ncbi:MAG: SCO family protein [Chitinophagaceae bacterium]
MSNRAITLTLIAFFILLSAGFMTYYFKTTRNLPKVLPVLGAPGHTVDTFTFINQDGKTITKKDVDGKVYVAEYFFTTCKGMCPKMNDNMVNIYKAFRGNPNFKILSHSVDPKNDTVAAMKAYSHRFDADANQWMFLTGDKKRLYEMARDSYLIAAEEDTTHISIDGDFIHDNHFILVDKTGHIRGVYDGLNKPLMDTLISDIQLLLNEPT